MSQNTAEVIELPEPLAIVEGIPYREIPDDLYIPPDALEVILEAFEGPLDLLLYLIRRQNLDILNIPIARITRQYVNYIDLMNGFRLELAAEYLVMAAVLAEIKSRMILPRQVESEDEEDDPRAFLIRKLQEYEAIKKAAQDIEELPRVERDIFAAEIDLSNIEVVKTPPEVQLNDMLFAFQDVLKRVEQLSHHQITKEPLSVRERMSTILENLKKSDSLVFSQLFSEKEGKNGVVVSFLAILELAKEGLINIIQTEPYSELRVTAAGSAA